MNEKVKNCSECGRENREDSAEAGRSSKQKAQIPVSFLQSVFNLQRREEPGGEQEGGACRLLDASLVWGGGMDDLEVKAIALSFDVFFWGSNSCLGTLDFGEV